jgi:hypothetical protein
MLPRVGSPMMTAIIRNALTEFDMNSSLRIQLFPETAAHHGINLAASIPPGTAAYHHKDPGAATKNNQC